MGLATDSILFSLGARATIIRAMAQGTRARLANGDDRRPHRDDEGQADEQNEFFRGILEQLRKD